MATSRSSRAKSSKPRATKTEPSRNADESSPDTLAAAIARELWLIMHDGYFPWLRRPERGGAAILDALRDMGGPRAWWDGELPWPLRAMRQGRRDSEARPSWTSTFAATLTPAAGKAEAPEQRVRRIVQEFLPEGQALPPTKSLELYYIVGLEGDTVLYGPEFAYLLDVGYPMIPSVRIGFRSNGNGDPNFPDFASPVIWSTPNRDPNQILFPVTPRDLLVAFEEGVTDAEARAALALYGTDISLLTVNTYVVKVNKPFHEGPMAAQIRHEVPRVRYVEMNRIQRLIDIRPGWQVRRVC